MQRKVIKQGTNTLMVSLPVKWTKKTGITKGDYLNLLEDQNTLLISKGETRTIIKKTEIKIKSTYKNTLIRAIIGNLYKKGYDQIEIKIDDTKLIKKGDS